MFRGAVAHRPTADTNEAEAAAILQALAPPIRPASTAAVPDEEQPADLHPYGALASLNTGSVVLSSDDIERCSGLHRACSEICDVAPWWTTRTNADGGGPAVATTVDLTVALWRLARLTSFRPGTALRFLVFGRTHGLTRSLAMCGA